MNFIRRSWQIWKSAAQVIGDAIARVVLSLFYFTIFLPFGLGVRLRSDYLDAKPSAKPTWLERRTRGRTMDDARRLS